MRAYHVTPGGGIEGLVPVTLPDPEPGPGQVLVRVRATSLNYKDLGVATRSRAPIVPLSDGAGEVAAVGAGVRRFAVGDRVTACFFPYWIDGEMQREYIRVALGDSTDGMLAEYTVAPEGGLVRTPAHLTDEEAATLPAAAVTAWNALYEESPMLPGQSVLLLGTGGVSIFGLQLARAGGLRTIITSSSDAKLERARALGAHATVNYRANPDWEREVLELTGGRGVHRVLEIGGAGTFAKSLAATRMSGSIVSIGHLTETDRERAGEPGLTRGIGARGIFVGSRAMFERMNAALELHEVHPAIDRVFDFDQAREAYRLLESQAFVGKIVVRV